VNSTRIIAPLTRKSLTPGYRQGCDEASQFVAALRPRL
jgi:hypothetical protein